jgi:regulator of protease activity HflC (stomatin/prohibitin superfamily)
MITEEKWRRLRATQTELAMIHEAEGLKKLTKKLVEAEIDSVDSLICACGTPFKGWLAVVLRVSRCRG